MSVRDDKPGLGAEWVEVDEAKRKPGRPKKSETSEDVQANK